MADPISSLSNSPSNSCIDDSVDGGASVAPVQSSVVPAVANQSLPDGGGLTQTPNGAEGLVQKFSAPLLPKAAVPSASPSSSPSTHYLASSSGAVPGGGSYRVGGSLMTSEIKAGALAGSNAEVGTVSVQYGKDNDVQLVGARETLVASHSGYGLSLTGDAGVARANLGEHNDDGSLGGNIGAGVELIGGEATISTPVGSLTGGLSVSMSLSGSMGVRDADHDGKPEFCGKFSIPAYTIGACIERFW